MLILPDIDQLDPDPYSLFIMLNASFKSIINIQLPSNFSNCYWIIAEIFSRSRGSFLIMPFQKLILSRIEY